MYRKTLIYNRQNNNNKSHVALVTLIDGSTIKYSQYSNVTKTAIYYVYNSKADDVTFYVPQ